MSDDIRELVERSSFGTPAAKAARASVSNEVAAKVVARARELRNAEARERYEAAQGELLYVTKAAWVRWEDLPVDARLTWGAAE